MNTKKLKRFKAKDQCTAKNFQLWFYFLLFLIAAKILLTLIIWYKGWRDASLLTKFLGIKWFVRANRRLISIRCLPSLSDYSFYCRALFGFLFLSSVNGFIITKRLSFSDIKLTLVFSPNSLSLNFFLSKLMLRTIVISVDNVAFGNRNANFSKLFNDFCAIPELVLNLKGIYLNRIAQLHVFNGFLEREASWIKSNEDVASKPLFYRQIEQHIIIKAANFNLRVLSKRRKDSFHRSWK